VQNLRRVEVDRARQLKELGAENARPKRTAADLTVDKLILEEGAAASPVGRLVQLAALIRMVEPDTPSLSCADPTPADGILLTIRCFLASRSPLVMHRQAFPR
jgi:hypothetical protein